MRSKETSARALQEIQERGDDVSLQRQIVAALLREEPMPRRALARYMGMEDRWSSLTARVRELLDLGLLREEGTREDPETGAQGAVLHVDDKAPEWLLGDYEPEPPEQEPADSDEGVLVSEAFLERVETCVENPGSLNAWSELKHAYEEEIDE